MTHLSRLIMPLLILVLVLALTACDRAISLSGSGDSLSVTVSENTINNSWRIVGGRWRIDSLSIDLKPNQAIVNTTLTPGRGGSYPAQAVLTPTVSNGIVVWSLTSATVNGTAATSEQLAQINDAIMNSWNNYISGTYGGQRVTAVTVTETDITYTLAR